MKMIERILALLTGSKIPGVSSSTDTMKPVAWSSMAAFLEELELFGGKHEELYDTAVRENLWEVIESGLIKQQKGYCVPRELGMFSPEANVELAGIMEKNLKQLRETFEVFQLDTEAKRLCSFSNPKLHTDKGKTVDEFFGSP